MTVTIKLSGLMTRYYKTSPKSRKATAVLKDGATVADLIDSYGIPREKVHLVVINKQRRELNDLLHEGDEVWALPLAHGG